MEYFRLTESNDLPEISHLAPFKVVLAIEDKVSHARQDEVSNWLVETGGKYVMICGDNCQSWEQSIRQANLAGVNIDEMKPEEFVMITTHAHDRLRNVFWHAKKHAHHPQVKFGNTITIHIANQNRSVEYLAMFSKA
jgi:hypothetical protein